MQNQNGSMLKLFSTLEINPKLTREKCLQSEEKFDIAASDFPANLP